MNSFHRTYFDIEKLESNFIRAWEESGNPRIEDYISGLSDDQCKQALQVIIPIDIQYRFQEGEDFDARRYVALGSHAIEIASELFADNTPETPANRLATVFDDNKSGQNGVNETISQTNPADQQFSNLISDRYKLLSKIGQGGMGSVWLAEQKKPVRRRVAIKIVNHSLESKDALARFSAEKQALAMMNHANIARVLDAGTTEDGKPFFAMELVKGIPITNYCNDNRLTVEQRLELLVSVCDAIQHAHQKGIIHRDLKPSNILVTLQEGKPVPKVIDFGLAKAVDHTARLTDETLVTEVGRVVGTLQYMSPEQASSSELDVDTRTDIYSLGIVLYQLLTDVVPLEQSTLTGKSLLQIVMMIRELQIIRPSRKLMDDFEKLELACAQRRTDSRQLIRKLKGELDWIVMKGLQRDRLERYQSADAFGDDLRRFLKDEAVEARPPSKIYLAKKFAKNNKLLLAAVSTTVGSMLVSVVVVSIFWSYAVKAKHLAVESEQRAHKAKQRAVESELRAHKAKKLAVESELQAIKEKEKAENVKNWFLEPLQSTDMLNGGKPMLVSDLLPKYLAILEGGTFEEEDSQLFQSQIQYEIGQILRRNGRYELAVDSLKESYVTRREILGNSNVETHDANLELQIAILEQLKVRIQSQVSFDKNEAAEIKRQFENALKEFDESGTLKNKILNVNKIKPVELGIAYLTAYKELKKIGEEVPDFINNAIEILSSSYAANNSNIIKFSLANAYLKEGSLENVKLALKLNLEIVEAWDKKVEHPVNVSKALNNSAESYNELARLKLTDGLTDESDILFGKAIEMYEKAFEIKSEYLSPNHNSRFNTIRNFIQCYCDASKFADAHDLFVRIYDEFETNQFEVNGVGVTLKPDDIENALQQMNTLRQKLATEFNLDENWQTL